MSVVVSFQRAINVGRGRSVPMADLKALYESVGASDVRTFLQSGNVVFTTDGDVPALTARLQSALAKRFGFAIQVINRTVAELRQAVDRNPFPGEAKADPGHLVVVFLPEVPAKAEREALLQPVDGPERLILVGRDLYVHYAAGIGRSKLKLPLITPGTARNWRTVSKLLAIAEAANSQPTPAKVESARAGISARSRKAGDTMAKGQQKPNKEKRKPKADKNKGKKGAAPSPMSSQPATPAPAAWGSKKT
jgi:uncharacterized protein (DUF1697 family)